MTFAVFLSVVTDWAFATGAVFTALTVMETVAGAEYRDPSFTLKVKASEPT
jgi:hypothetical protein